MTKETCIHCWWIFSLCATGSSLDIRIYYPWLAIVGMYHAKELLLFLSFIFRVWDFLSTRKGELPFGIGWGPVDEEPDLTFGLASLQTRRVTPGATVFRQLYQSQASCWGGEEESRTAAISAYPNHQQPLSTAKGMRSEGHQVGLLTLIWNSQRFCFISASPFSLPSHFFSSSVFLFL